MIGDRAQVAIAVGIGTLCAIAAIVTAVREPGPVLPEQIHDRATARRHCAGAKIVLAVIAKDGAHGLVRVADPSRREWQVSTSTVSRVTFATEGGWGVTRFPVDDSDQGAWARVRPNGDGRWCVLDVSLFDSY